MATNIHLGPKSPRAQLNFEGFAILVVSHPGPIRPTSSGERKLCYCIHLHFIQDLVLGTDVFAETPISGAAFMSP
jgi:hypothetical protein